MRSARASVAVVFVIFILLLSCSRKSQQEVFPFAQPMAESIRFQLAVYLLPGSTRDPAAVLREVIGAQHPNLKPVAELPQEPREPLVYAHLQKNVRQEYQPPRLESLRYSGHGLNRKQAEALQKSERAYILEFAHPKQNVWSALSTANKVVEEIARKTGGLVWDEETREVFSPDAWHKTRLASWTSEIPDVSDQIVVQIYEKDEYARAISLGMSKVGLPDVVVEGLPWSSQTQVGNLINIFCQAMTEGAILEKSGKFNLDLHAIKDAQVREWHLKSLGENATAKACLLLKSGKRDEGDPKNRLIELASDRYEGNDSHAKQASMLSSFFGTEDSVTSLQHNKELLDASAKAREKLPELQKAFNDGLEPGEYIQVKAPFATPDGNREWMWVEITSWKQHKITGLLQNEPYEVTDLHSGQVVHVNDGDVFDYIRQYPDQRQEGNTTRQIIQKMEDQKKIVSKAAVHALNNACDRTESGALRF